MNKQPEITNTYCKVTKTGVLIRLLQLILQGKVLGIRGLRCRQISSHHTWFSMTTLDCFEQQCN